MPKARRKRAPPGGKPPLFGKTQARAFVQRLSLRDLYSLETEYPLIRNRLSLWACVEAHNGATLQVEDVREKLEPEFPLVVAALGLDGFVARAREYASGKRNGKKGWRRSTFPELELLKSASRRRIEEEEWQPREKAEGVLAAWMLHADSYGDHEALVYFLSRGQECKEAVASVLGQWKFAADEAVKRCAEGIPLTVIGNSSEETKSKRFGMKPLSEAADVEQQSELSLRNFWGGHDSQEFTIDATMLRTAQWARIEGFEPWWRRYAREVRQGIAQGGLAVLPGAYYLFGLCRSDYAIDLLGDALAHGLWALAVGEVDAEKGWRVIRETPDKVCTTGSAVVAAAIVFAASRVPGAAALLRSETVEHGAEYLRSRQSYEGGWRLVGDEHQCRSESTAPGGAEQE